MPYSGISFAVFGTLKAHIKEAQAWFAKPNEDSHQRHCEFGKEHGPVKYSARGMQLMNFKLEDGVCFSVQKDPELDTMRTARVGGMPLFRGSAHSKRSEPSRD